MTEPSWTMTYTDRQIVSGPYYVAPTLGIDYAAPWVDAPGLKGLAKNLPTWLAIIRGTGEQPHD